MGIGQNGRCVSVESKWRPEPSGRLPPAPLLHSASAEPRPTALVSFSCFSLLRHCLPRQPTICVYLLCQWYYPWESCGHAVNKRSFLSGALGQAVWSHCVCSGLFCWASFSHVTLHVPWDAGWVCGCYSADGSPIQAFPGAQALCQHHLDSS